ncbi:MAG TPA: RagB/SusD family nutrient uptake outer membrane protein [Puia sp.]|nr:RagB/SusD family nutrient uptake outer membrane protein [Puia sp.]
MSLLLQSIYTILRRGRAFATGLLLVALTLGGCKKYLEVPLPASSIAAEGVFNNDGTAAAALNGVYAALYNGSVFDYSSSLTYTLGLYGDELVNYSTIFNNKALYMDAVTSSVSSATGYWTYLYSQLYAINQAIQGIQANNALTYKNQWLGEAYFLRGLAYFYLTNLYGDVALVLTPDYLKNNGLKRSPQSDVYKQIIADLKQAQQLLDDDYHDDGGAVTTDKGRPNRMAVDALLARTYLYTKDWPNAEIQAGSVIANTGTYQLPTPDKVFLLNSQEVIWGLVPMVSNLYSYMVRDAAIYPIPKGTTPGSPYGITLSDSLANAFEPGDLRYTNWIGADTVPASGLNPQHIYHYAYKYKVKGTLTAPLESVVLFRLAEQYLIRAEARAQQNKLSGGNGATDDLNVIRARAGLPPTTAVSQADILNAIQQERRVELFCENGHHFFDLRRTGALDAYMTKLVPLKGGAGWNSNLAYWPIPVTDIQNDPNLTQTPGYQ